MEPQVIGGNMKLTWNEWHAFLIGWGHGISWWCQRFPMPIKYRNPMVKEYHYYAVGYGIGVISFIFIITCAITVIILEVKWLN